MKEFVMILSMWGQTATGNWTYIGNQYVYTTPMTQEVCEKKINSKHWSTHQNNQYYRIQFDCMHVSKEKK